MSERNFPYITFRRYFGANTMWYLQFHFVCDKLFTSFITMTSLCFFVQLADRTLILSKGSFSVYIIAFRLLLNHSPCE